MNSKKEHGSSEGFRKHEEIGFDGKCTYKGNFLVAYARQTQAVILD